MNTHSHWKSTHYVRWMVAAMVAVPLTILLHELAHALTGLALGHPDVVLHFASVSSGAEKAGAPLWELGLVAGAGPLVSAGMVFVCWRMVLNGSPEPFWVSVALFAPVKFLIGVAYIVALFTDRDVSGATFDEHTFATAFGLSPLMFVAAGLLVLGSSWYWFIARIPSASRWWSFASMLLGFVLGAGLYLGFLGPWILP